MEKLKHIYLVRHGESVSNETGIREGAVSELSESGVKQVELVAKRFQSIPIQVVLSSAYTRAQETGKHIAEQSGVPFEIFEEVHERVLPKEVIGKHRDDPMVQEAVAKFEYGWLNDARGDDGEHFTDIRERAAEVTKTLEARKEEHIAISTHGFFMVFFLAYHLLGDYLTPDLFIHEFLRSFHISNTGITHFVITEDGRWVLISWNDSAHLGVLET